MKRSLGFWKVWGLVVGSAIGAGILLVPALLAPYGSYSLAGWTVTAVAMIAVALSLGSLAKRAPGIGGPYAYARQTFGDIAGFFVAWAYWISVWTGVGGIAVGLTGYLGVFFPGLITMPLAAAAVAILIVWLFTALNIAGVKEAATVNLVLTILRLLPILLVGAAGILVGDVTSIAAPPPQESSFMIFLAGMFLIMIGAFVGFEGGSIPAGNIIDPDKTIPRALVIGALTISAVYIIGTAGVMAVVSMDDLATSSSPFSSAASAMFGSWGSKLVAIGAIISMLGVLNATILLTGQMPLAAALDGLFPAPFRKLNANDSPAFSLIASSCLSTFVIGMNYSEGVVAAYRILFLMGTITAVLVYAVSALADLATQLRDKRAGGRLKWQSVLIAITALTVSLFAVIGSGVEPAKYTALLLLAGLPVYVWLKKSKSKAP